ncbi:MAG: hypothetical protein PVJ05_04355 [Candidatus Thorarchaeota archaeon]|jgi:hypothetical protein
MQQSSATNNSDLQRLVAIIVTVLLLGIIALMSPFAVLLNNNPPPYYPPPPGWSSSVTIYLWAAQFDAAHFQIEYSVGGVMNFHTFPFVLMTLIYFAIQIVVGMKRVKIKYGAVVEIVLFLTWIAVCQLIYGTLQDWTLTQVPILPITGILVLLVAIGINTESSLFQK